MWTGFIPKPYREVKIMSPSKPKARLRAAALPALIVALLTVGIGQPAHAQVGFLKKLKEASKTIKEKAEQADTAMTKVEETAGAVECLANDPDCAEQPEVQGSPEVVADSGSTLSPSTPGAVSPPGQCERQPRAPPDSSEAS
jgi:hypothetical protein